MAAVRKSLYASFEILRVHHAATIALQKQQERQATVVWTSRARSMTPLAIVMSHHAAKSIHTTEVAAC
eukprot:5558-Heterococcus_DN1.PRE.2